MTQRFFVGTIKPSKWLALTMSFNISKSQKRRDITLNYQLKNQKDEAGFISHLKIDEKCEIDVILG